MNTGVLDKRVTFRITDDGEARIHRIPHEVGLNLATDDIIAVIHAVPAARYHLGDDDGIYGLPICKKK